ELAALVALVADPQRDLAGRDFRRVGHEAAARRAGRDEDRNAEAQYHLHFGPRTGGGRFRNLLDVQAVGGFAGRRLACLQSNPDHALVAGTYREERREINEVLALAIFVLAGGVLLPRGEADLERELARVVVADLDQARARTPAQVHARGRNA